MKTIHNAHVKEFETVYNKGTHKTKWIKVVLQVLANTEDEYDKIRKELVTHMDKDLPRYMKLNEQ